MSENTHRIIEAADTPASIGPGDLALTIAWPDGSETVEHVSEKAAALLGYQDPDPQPPASPAWMVEVAREAARALCVEGSGDAVEACQQVLRLALERGHVVDLETLEPVWRAPSEEETLKAAREDAAQVVEAMGLDWNAKALRAGEADTAWHAMAALQARRNMLREMGAVRSNWVPPVDGFKMIPPAPAVDLEAALKRAWMDGFISAQHALDRVRVGHGVLGEWVEKTQSADISSTLSTLPTREA